jgi:RNA polymerase sigma-70 factor (ECF subfamily)
MEERFSQLEAAIATLPPQQATVYRLSKLEGLSREQVAERMGISENTVKNHLAVALQSLRKNAGKLGLWLL